MAQQIERVFFVTSDSGKVASLTKALTGLSLTLIHHNPNANTGWWVRKWRKIQDDDIGEISKAKAIDALSRVDQPAIVQDVALCIPCLNGFPGPYVEYVIKTLSAGGFMRMLAARFPDRTICEFDLCLAYMDRGLSQPAVFRSKVRGSLQYWPYGENMCDAWFPLWEYFVPVGHENTIAVMTDKERQEWHQELDEQEPPHYTTQFRQWLIAERGVKGS